MSSVNVSIYLANFLPEKWARRTIDFYITSKNVLTYCAGIICYNKLAGYFAL